MKNYYKVDELLWRHEWAWDGECRKSCEMSKDILQQKYPDAEVYISKIKLRRTRSGFDKKATEYRIMIKFKSQGEEAEFVLIEGSKEDNIGFRI